jgi:N-acetylneuraminic acid mutarotase
VYVFGGHNGNVFFDEVYRLDVKTRHWQKLPKTEGSPTQRACFSVDMLDEEKGIIMLIGG